jgi:Lhr-like helicase
MSAVPKFTVFVRSQSGKVSMIAEQEFMQPLMEGDKVPFQGETWVVVEIRAGERLPVVVLEFPESS